MPTRTDYEHILKTTNEPYAVLTLQGEASALVTQRGGRVLGIFPAADAPNLLWTNSSAFASPADFTAFTERNEWNLGGERIWIAPEIQYNVRDRADFWGTLHVPAAMDPGHYMLETHPYGLRLHTQMRLPAYNLAEGQQELAIDRRISPADNPLQTLDLAADGVRFCGIQQQVTLRTESPDIPAETWVLVQVQAGGQLIIPCAPRVEATDYFGSVPDEARKVRQGDAPHLRLNLTGKRQYKVGYMAASMTGRMGYWQALGDGRAALLVRNFYNNPSNRYAEEPPEPVGRSGHSVHVYNDGGEFGGDQAFGEMECTGTTIHAGTALPNNSAVDHFALWVYTGPEAAVRAIAYQLLGVRP